MITALPAVSVSPVKRSGAVRSQSIRLRTILVPLDFSSDSLRVLKYSALLASKFGATLHLIHVQHSTETTALEAAGDLLLNDTDAIGLLQDRLAEVQEKNDVGFSPDNCHVSVGRPFEQICTLARTIGADLIVMPTRGKNGLKGILLGSTAERVIRFAPCPVLIVRNKSYNKQRAQSVARSDLKMRRILVPVDFSDCSVAAVKHANFMAKEFEARLRLLHIIYPYPQLTSPDKVSPNLLPAVEVVQLTARKRMQRFRRSQFPRNMPCEMEIRIGHAVAEICAQSRSPEVDLVVLSTHGRSGFRHALIGSVAERVARYADCSVLVVPQQICD